MACYYPLTGYRSRIPNPDTGKRSITFRAKEGFLDMPVTVKCGQCIGCRLAHSLEWAVRITNEASLYTENCFLTLTYNPENEPPNGNLRKEDFQKFMKRLRHHYPREVNNSIRYFHVGEYGENFGRPHYHACLFNIDFLDKRPWSRSQSGYIMYRSEELEKLWPHGYSTIQDLTFENAAYAARYCLKKIKGMDAFDHYALYTDLRTGEVIQREREYTTMSRRPGIAKEWVEKYLSDVYPDDHVVIDGRKFKVPKYYDARFEILDENGFALTKGKRKKVGNSEKVLENNSYPRLRVREDLQRRKSKKLTRSYEDV